jgi:uncharacterized phage protein (TIGR01671 family)
MREIRFRGKTLTTRQWVYGPWIYELNGILFIRERDSLTGYAVNPNTVGQSIGLKDKKGHEIYEGDIAKINMGRVNDDILVVAFGGPWDYAGFGLTGKRIGWKEGDSDPPECWDTLNPQYAVELEVIGNIHENAELLN